MPDRPARLAVLFSGGGRTLENLAQVIAEGEVNAEIPIAISSHAGAGGIARAEAAGILAKTIDYREHGDALSERICEELEAHDVDWIVLAGFIRFFRFPDRYRHRVINIHPALLPAFGGKGYYGSRVHQAVIAAGARVSGCTVHFVDEEYDHGPMILQRVVPVHFEDTPDTLAARVFDEECIAYPEALRLAIDGRLEVIDGRVRITQTD